MSTIHASFDTKVSLTLMSGFLAASGTLLCDPIAHVSEIQIRKTVNNRNAHHTVASGSKETHVTVTSRRLASSKQRIFTAHPAFDEILSFVVPPGNPERPTSDDAKLETESERFLVIDIVDSSNGFFGQATCPFSLSVPSRGNQRLMLQPRNLRFPDDPEFLGDLNTLQKFQIDDFGFIQVDWRVSMVPRGGALILTPSPADAPRLPPPLPFPIGAVVKCVWLSEHRMAASSRGATYSTLVEFGTSDENCHPVKDMLPVFIPISNPSQLEACTFSCKVQQGQHGPSRIATVRIPLQPMFSDSMNRDVRWCSPVYDDAAYTFMGLLFCSLRLIPKLPDAQRPNCVQERCPKINDPAHQEQANHPPSDWGRPQPDCPLSAYQQIFWESDAHVARSTERRWKRECIVNAHPTQEHVRHIFEALLGRVSLDVNVAQLASAFFNKSVASVAAADLKQFLIAVAFNAEGLDVQEASRFAFVALRREVERAVQVADLVFMLEHSLLPKTLDMPLHEVERRILDIFGSQAYASFDDFQRYFVSNYAMWFDLGVAVAVAGTPLGEEPKISAVPGQAGKSVNWDPSVQAKTATGLSPDGSGDIWRTFTVRVLKTGRPFSVTAHVQDLVVDVQRMVEPSTTIAAARQQWIMQGIPIDPRRPVGDVIPKKPMSEITIDELEEMAKLTFVYREKGKRWDQKFPVGEKVLKLRAHVQQRTNIPLSRCGMKCDGQTMWDRHTLDHYHVTDGTVIEIFQD